MNKIELELRELFIQSMHGEVESYEQFLEIVSAIVRKFLFHMGRKTTSEQTLEDLHQDVMIKIHQKKHTYHLEAPILPWIYAVTRYSYFDFYRKQKRSPREIVFEESLWVIETEENQTSLDEVWEALSTKQQEMLRLIKIEGQSYQETAKALSISETSLKVSLHRIVKTLKKRLNK